MASATVARFSGRVVSRSLRTIASGSSGVMRMPTPAAACWAATSKRCKSTKFATTHEYMKLHGDIGIVGITDHATKALGDIVFVALPDVGDTLEAGESFGSVESVKAASDVYAPASGEVIEINGALADEPGMLNEDPMGAGWFMKLKITGDVPDTLLDKKAYEASIGEEH